MSFLSIKEIQQIAREYNANFEIDENSRLPIVSAEGIVLRPSLQSDEKHSGWKMTRLNQRTSLQIAKMTNLKNLLNGD